MKKAADASGRKIAFIGMSLHHYLEAAAREGRAPFDPRELVPASAIEDCNPNELLIVTTGSQVQHALSEERESVCVFRGGRGEGCNPNELPIVAAGS